MPRSYSGRCQVPLFFGGADFHAEIRLRFLWDELSISQSHNIASDLGFLRKSHHIATCCISLFHSGFETCLKYRQLCINDLWKLRKLQKSKARSQQRKTSMLLKK